MWWALAQAKTSASNSSSVRQRWLRVIVSCRCHHTRSMGFVSRRILGQVMQFDPMAPSGQILADRSAVVETGVVADHVNLSKAAEPRAQVVQVGQEELSVSPRARRRQQQRAGAPVQRTSQVPLLVVARGDHFGLLAANHPLAADLGVQSARRLRPGTRPFRRRARRPTAGGFAAVSAS